MFLPYLCAFIRIWTTEEEWQCVKILSHSSINCTHIVGLISSSLSIQVKYSSNASATQLASHHSFNLYLAYFIALRSNGSVSLAHMSIFEDFSKNVANSFLLFNFASRNSFIIILQACLAMSVAH